MKFLKIFMIQLPRVDNENINEKFRDLMIKKELSPIRQENFQISFSKRFNDKSF